MGSRIYFLPSVNERLEENGFFGSKLNVPSSDLVMYNSVMFKSIGTGPGEVIFTGGLSSFRCILTLSTVICN